MTIHNRDIFLERLAGNLGRPRRTEGVDRPVWRLNPQAKVLPDATEEALIDVLEKQCEATHTSFKRTTREGLHQVLKETIESYGGKTVVAANDERNKTYGLDGFYEELKQDEVEFHLWDHKNGEESRTIAERADVGITFSDITLAETATVTLFMDKNNGRGISLLPRTYIAIIPKSTIVPRFTQAAKQIHKMNEEGVDLASCITFISGPSKSGDIEMELIYGVHGPVEATYILVED